MFPDVSDDTSGLLLLPGQRGPAARFCRVSARSPE
jgi:hypothetical protein